MIQVWELLRGQFLLWIAVSQRGLGRTAEDIRRTTLANHSTIVSLIRSRDAKGAARHVLTLLESAADELRNRHPQPVTGSHVTVRTAREERLQGRSAPTRKN